MAAHSASARLSTIPETPTEGDLARPGIGKPTDPPVLEHPQSSPQRSHGLSSTPWELLSQEQAPLLPLGCSKEQEDLEGTGRGSLAPSSGMGGNGGNAQLLAMSSPQLSLQSDDSIAKQS